MNTICLAHDIGHPPFGHGGEVALNYCMRSHGGFEGNGQTLRILAKLDKYTESFGLNPTRRVLLGILKYPCTYSKVVKSNLYGKKNTNSPNWLFESNNQKPPKCYFDQDKDVVDWIFECFDKSDINEFTKFENEKSKHRKSIYNSLDTSIMELADDISYGVHDLEDAISLGMINRDIWKENIKRDDFSASEKDYNKLTDNLFSSESHRRKDKIGYLINKFITNVFISEVNGNFKNPLLRYNAYLDESHRSLNKKLKDIVYEYVIQDPNVQQLELKGQKIITELFEVLAEDPKRFLPKVTFKRYEEKDSDIRVVCDFVAGMTDDYATRLYEKIFLPRKGSIFERL